MTKKELKYYRPENSNKPGKKFMVRIYIPETKKDKIIHFGNTRYEDYTQHKNPYRKRNYLIRSGYLRKGGRLSKNDYTSPNFWSRRKLWDSKEKYGSLPRPKINRN
jgi:hypothetical protein